MKKRIWIFLFAALGLAIVVLTVCSFLLFYLPNTKTYSEDKFFKITKGQSFSEIAAEMKSKGIIRDDFSLKIAAKITGRESDIIARNYFFSGGLNNNEILDILTNPSYFQTTRIRILEGLTIKQIAKVAEDRFNIPQKEFITETQNKKYIKELGLEGKIKNLEGFLFPDTYIVDINTDAKDLVKILFDEFKKQVLQNSGMMQKMGADNTNILSVVTLASIIEAETHLKDELEIISGVYHNRLKKNMRLEADPTIQYALPDGPKERLLYEDLKINSPYNTYKITGLPPGPINNPGLDEIKAALNPAKHNYIFFVATGEGGHNFSETYDQHLKAIKEYRKKINAK